MSGSQTLVESSSMIDEFFLFNDESDKRASVPDMRYDDNSQPHINLNILYVG